MSGLQALFAPRGVVVVGASWDGGKLGAVMARALASYGCVLVNSRRPDPAAGVYATVAEAGPVDLAVLCVPAAATPDALADAADAGVRAALVCAGGFGESGATGTAHELALAEIAERTGIRVLGPNTSGFFVPARGLVASFVPGAGRVPAGDVAVVAASGGVNHALAFDLAAAGVGVSLAVGIGGGLDVRATDVLDHLATDPDTAAVALHLETVPDGPRLLTAVRALTAVKPVVALVVGRADVGDFARSHTGALATSWRTTRAALRQAGAVVVDDERELVDAVTTLSTVRLPPASDPAIGVVTAQAGPGLLLVDRLRADGLRVPELTDAARQRVSDLLPPMTYQRNPVDTGRPDSGFASVLRAVADDVDVLVGYALTEPDSVDLVAATQEAGLPAAAPTVLATGGPVTDVEQARKRLRKVGVPLLTGPTAAANAVRALVDDARAQHSRLVTPRTPTRPQWTFNGPVDEARAKGLLATLGIQTPAGRVCRDRAAARQALADLNGPVAVKILDPTVTHKTEIGGVHLNVGTEAELDAALDLMPAGPYLLEPMAPPGVELVVGARRDPVFGPIVLLGLGGTTAEALADVTIRVAPLSTADALRMPTELAGRALLTGWRGAPPLDHDELADILVTLGDVLTTTPEVTEVEVNPLRVTDQGLVALDCVIGGLE